MRKLSGRIVPTTIIVLICGATAAWLPAQHTQANAGAIRIPFETYTLPNGLTVVLSPNHTIPEVAVVVWYHVGSKNEMPGRTGLAHLFEHLMFQGSGHAPYGVFAKLTEGVGGDWNGSTGRDWTTYWELVPANYLEDEIWIDSDRMGFLLDTLDLKKLDAQREVVKNERRERVDNPPYGRVNEILAAAIYPASHPYSWPVSGSMADLSAASEEDVRNFFRLYYAPNNAVLSIAGEFDATQARRWIAKYFGDLPRGEPIVRPAIPVVPLAREDRLVYEDRVEVPRLDIRWPTVGQFNDDRFALTVLGSILTGGRTARLPKALVYDLQMAAEVFGGQGWNENAGEFFLTITPQIGHSLTDLEAASLAIIEKLKVDGPTVDEVQEAMVNLQTRFIGGLQSNLEKARTLAGGAGLYNDPGHFNIDYQKSLTVTADDVKRAANAYLTTRRVVLSTVPIGKLDQASKPSESRRAGRGISR